nr:E3 ubiquitin-protein ligase synoviolin B [Onthophagus taurus]
MRLIGISLFSIALTASVIANAYYQKKQFYPSVVYITKSNPSMAVMYCQAFILVFLMGKLMRRIFFGELRTSEFEHLMERSWYAITETCLAFTVFRDDFNPKFVALFTLLLFLKSFHWLAEDRVDYMERSPIIGLLFHIRVLSLLFVLGALDFYFIEHAYYSTVTKGASVQLVFGFEYAILMTMALNVAIKYALYSVDLNSETPWENKAVFLLYTELVMGFIKVILYLAFVIIMVRVYTLPLFAFRPMYYTIRNFKKAFNDVRLSRRAIHNMNTLYPDATQEELSAGDNVCIICREEMTTGCKKLPCNHIFHTACLRSWFQRQQTCPTCRLNILGASANADRQRQGQNVQQNQQNLQQNGLPGGLNGFAFGANGFLAPNVFNVFANVRNPQQQQQGNQGAQNNNLPNNGNNNNNQVPTNTPPTPGPPPPFQMPPFPFMNPFMTPPPIPPQNLASLTREQLQQLEGNERANVEARIQWLRNINVMLDAAVIMLQQYSAAAAVSMAVPNVTTTTEPTTTSASSNSTIPQQPTASTSSEGENAASSIVDSTATAAGDSNISKSDPIPGSSTSDAATAAEEEIRRKRLQKFEQQTSQD